MAPTPVRHPLREPHGAARRRAISAHPAGRARRPAADVPPVAGRPPAAPVPAVPDGAGVDRVHDQAGSMTTEYGLIVVVGATVCSLVIKWASGGAVFELLNGVLQAAKGLVGF